MRLGNENLLARRQCKIAEVNEVGKETAAWKRAETWTRRKGDWTCWIKIRKS